MDIHKPKPWHGWREFLKEYAIVVVGVLTALGFEQAVEAIHHTAQAHEAREAIDAEVVADVTRVQQRDSNYGCVDARLDALDRIVAATGPDGSIRTPSWIGRPPRYAIESQRWDAASQSGRISLLSSDWQANFGFIYTTLRYYWEMNLAEQEIWSKLDALSGVDRLTPDGKLAVKAEIEQARFYNDSIHQIASIVRNRAVRAALRLPNRHDKPFTVCWSIDMPRAQALRLQAQDYRRQRVDAP